MIGRSNGNLDLDRIQVQQIERIEIIENAMSVNYGTNALGGTINIITKKNHTQDWDAQVMGQIQSNQQYNFSSSLSHSNKYISSTVNYNLIHFDGFSTDTLRSLEWNPKTQHAVNAQLNFLVPNPPSKLIIN
jgi:outer membrane receptor for ferrienterochelin and colicins